MHSTCPKQRYFSPAAQGSERQRACETVSCEEGAHFVLKFRPQTLYAFGRDEDVGVIEVLDNERRRKAVRRRAHRLERGRGPFVERQNKLLDSGIAVAAMVRGESAWDLAARRRTAHQVNKTPLTALTILCRVPSAEADAGRKGRTERKVGEMSKMRNRGLCGLCSRHGHEPSPSRRHWQPRCVRILERLQGDAHRDGNPGRGRGSMQSGLLGLLGCCTAVWTLVYAALRRSAAARRLLSSPVPSSIFERRQDGSSPPAWLSLDWVIVSGGIGWLGFDTPRYNELPSRLVGTGLSSAGAAKSFDDPPSRMRWHRRLVRSAMDVGYGIGAVVVVLGVGVAFVVLLKAVVQSLGALRGLVMRDGGKAALAGSGQAMRMVKRAVVPILSEKAPLATTASSNLMLRPMVSSSTRLRPGRRVNLRYS